MKKLLLSLATISLTIGSLAGLIAPPKMTQSTPVTTTKTEAKSNTEADDIAKKLQGQSIKLDPYFWLGRNLTEDGFLLNDIIVKKGILTQDEAQWVYWNNLTINVAGWYWKAGFTVSVDGASSASGTTCLDADSGETTAQIAAKLNSKPIQLNYDYWNGKNLKTNLVDLRSIIVNEGILNKIEASEITGLSGGDAYYTVNNGWLYSNYYINYIINDNNTVSGTPDNPGVQVLNDGKNAQQLANQINFSSYIHIPQSDNQTYADNPKVLNDIKKGLITQGYYNASQLQYIHTPHKFLRIDFSNPNQVSFTFNKDGQIAQTKPCTVFIGY